jgi:hypothetical protein
VGAVVSHMRVGDFKDIGPATFMLVVGDGKTDFAVWRPSNWTWHVIESGSGRTISQARGSEPISR